ncbi:MAG TPA: TonB-dependent receptor [Blastocatellia bacterium]|nr:TonB-dependent receptor [Blastocatellia bacterium]
MRHFFSRLAPLARHCGLLLAVLLAVGLSPQPGNAQVLYGTIVGNVVDESGAVVPDAKVTVTSKETGQTRETETNDAGDYAIPNLLPGVYEVKVSKQGFATFTQTDLTVTTNNVTRVNVQLKVGNVTDVMTIAADATTLQTDTAEVKTQLSGQEINTLPLGTYRNYQSLINLVPGATPAQFQNANTDSPARALTTNINGTNRNNNNTRLDGATNVFIWLPHHTVYVAPVETVQEVNVVTNSFDAEQGMAGGAAITVQTKSGTNEIHGSAFGYHTNQDLQARNFFLPPNREKPTSKIDIFGGTIGGPIVKDKLFYFGGWERMTDRFGFFSFATVPTLAERAGDFSNVPVGTIYNPFSTALNNPTARTPFPNNRIPSNLISEVSRRLLELVPLPNITPAADGTQNYFASATQQFNRDNFDVKINWNRTSNHSIWGKYSVMDAQVVGVPVLGAAGGPCLCSGGTGVGDTFVQVVTIGQTWTIGSGMVVDGNFGFTRMGQQVLGNDFGTNFGSEVLGIPGTNGPDIRQSGLPSFSFNTYTALGQVNSWEPIFRKDQSFTGTVNISQLKGSHDVRYGFDMVRHELNHWQPEIGFGPRGGFSISGNGVLNGVGAANRFHSFAQFLLGLYDTGGKSLQAEEMTGREWQFGWYIRDRWQARQNLTLTMGLRFEYYPLITRKDRGIERLDLETFNVLIGGRGNIPEDAGIDAKEFFLAPRLGIAWRIGDSTVIRSGYGMTINPLPFSRPLRGFYPLTISSSFNTGIPYVPFGTFEEGIPEILPPDLSSGVVPLPRNVDMRTPSPELRRGYIQSWNLVVERKLPGDMVGQVGYVGTQTTRQLADLNINAAGAGEGRNGQPFFQRFGHNTPVLFWSGFLSANYHSLQAALNRRLSQGLFIKAAYTWSKAINMTDDDGWAGVSWNHPSVFHRNRARAGYDIPHILQVGFAAELPFGRGKAWANEGVAAAVLGGWQVNGVFSATSGRPFTITADGSSLNAPGNLQTADQVKPGVEITGEVGPGEKYFDVTAFAQPTGPRFGTTGRNILRGPGYTNLDFSLFRQFALTERFRLDVRAEAFNLTNTPHFNNPSGSITSSTFGEVRSSFGERYFRFGLRLGF